MYTLIDGITPNEIILYDLSRPYTESCTTLTMNAITNGYYYIQTINHRRAILVLSIMQKMHITFFLKFTFFKRIINVTCNYGLILLKQLSHLSLCQPHGLILQPNINLRLSIWSLIDYNLLIFLHTLFVSFAKLHFFSYNVCKRP